MFTNFIKKLFGTSKDAFKEKIDSCVISNDNGQVSLDFDRISDLFVVNRSGSQSDFVVYSDIFSYFGPYKTYRFISEMDRAVPGALIGATRFGNVRVSFVSGSTEYRFNIY